jgi:hypothetical protein
MYATIPEGRRREEIKDVVRLSSGLIGTMAALVLGLLIASAKSSYDARGTQIKRMTADIILLDDSLAHYGPEAHILRVALRDAVPPMINQIWNERDNGSSAPFVPTAEAQAFVDKIQELKPDTEAKHALQAQVLNAIADLGQARLSLFAGAHDSIPMPFLGILIFWLTMIFASFGLFVRANSIVVITFFVGALSVAGAFFLILEMDQPLAGLLQISSEPLREALTPLAH